MLVPRNQSTDIQGMALWLNNPEHVSSIMEQFKFCLDSHDEQKSRSSIGHTFCVASFKSCHIHECSYIFCISSDQSQLVIGFLFSDWIGLPQDTLALPPLNCLNVKIMHVQVGLKYICVKCTIFCNFLAILF